jgi:hypothetical protein
MSTDTLEFPPIEDIPVTRTELAAAANAAVVDIEKVDLTKLALAKFGPWREQTATAKAEFTALVLDLATQSGIDDAISLRSRKIKQPLADARKTAEALKSKLSAVSKAVGAELPLIEAAWADAAGAITPRIEAAQKVLDDAKAEAARIERERVAAHQSRIATIRAYLDRCRAPGMTSERVANGIKALAALTFPQETWQDFAVPAANAQCETLEAMRTLQVELLTKEQEAAKLEEQRQEVARAQAALEAQRVELARQAAELAAQRAESERLEALAVERRTAEARRILEDQAREAQQAAALRAMQAAALRAMQEAAELQRAAAFERHKPPAKDWTDHDPDAAASQPAQPAPETVDPDLVLQAAEEAPNVKLGDINAALGFALSEAFIAETLGVRCLDTKGRAVLFSAASVLSIKAQLLAHVHGCTMGLAKPEGAAK